MNASFSPLKKIVRIDFSNHFSDVALLEHHGVIVPTSTIPPKANNANSRLR
jgi:hypothetical protein